MQFQNPANFIAHETILAGQRVKIRTDLKVELADAADQEHGVALLFNGKSSYAAGDPVGVRLHVPSITLVAAGAFSAGAAVKRMADGKVDDTGTGAPFGIALEASTADGDLVNVLPIISPALTQSVVLGNANAEIGGLTISGAYSQAEVTALRDKAEELADDVRAIHAALCTAGILSAT